jgi:hypothetical protein
MSRRSFTVLLVGIALGFGAGWVVLDWHPWSSNPFAGLSCWERMEAMTAASRKGTKARAVAEREDGEADEREPC